MYLKVFISKSGKRCVALAYKTSYREFLISFDVILLSELSNRSISEIYTLPVGEYDINIERGVN